MDHFLWRKVLAIGGACAIATGCARLRAGRPLETGEPQEPVWVIRVIPAARVIRVNPRHRYVILECVVLPQAGEKAKVYRGEREVAELRIARQQRGAFAAAEIVEGNPEAGDAVRLERLVPVTGGQEERR